MLHSNVVKPKTRCCTLMCVSTNDQMIQPNVVPPIVWNASPINSMKMRQKLSLVNNSISLFVWAAASKLMKELVGDFCVEIAFAAHAWAVNRAKYGVWGRSGVIFIVSRMSLSRVTYESQTMSHSQWLILYHLANHFDSILTSFDIFSGEIKSGQAKVSILVEHWISSHVRMEFAPTLKWYHKMVPLTFVIDALKGYTYTRRSVL